MVDSDSFTLFNSTVTQAHTGFPVLDFDLVKWKYSQAYNLVDVALACMKMHFLEERRSCHYSMWRGSSGSRWGSKQSFTRASLLYMLEQDPALSTSLCPSHTNTHTYSEVVFLWLHLLIKSCENKSMSDWIGLPETTETPTECLAKRGTLCKT